VIGVAIGLAAAFLLRQAVAQLLYGVAPNDLLTFTLVPIALVLVASSQACCRRCAPPG
jgi:predicted lysophospholipase L1 biosynthesis ABC-type transport system permease subunit